LLSRGPPAQALRHWDFGAPSSSPVVPFLGAIVQFLFFCLSLFPKASPMRSCTDFACSSGDIPYSPKLPFSLFPPHFFSFSEALALFLFMSPTPPHDAYIICISLLSDLASLTRNAKCHSQAHPPRFPFSSGFFFYQHHPSKPRWFGRMTPEFSSVKVFFRR